MCIARGCTEQDIPKLVSLNKAKMLNSLLKIDRWNGTIQPISFLMLPKDRSLEDIFPPLGCYSHIRERIDTYAKNTAGKVTYTFMTRCTGQPPFALRKDVENLGWKFASFFNTANWQILQQQLGVELSSSLFAETFWKEIIAKDETEEDADYPFIRSRRDVDSIECPLIADISEYALSARNIFAIELDIEPFQQTSSESEVNTYIKLNDLKRSRLTDNENEGRVPKKRK
jgi:hypothetical protein